MTPPFLIREVSDEAGTLRLAEDLAMILRPGDVIALEGDLGMGKSAFARALLRALADDDELEVPSPTFTLVQTYEVAGLPVAHFDLYRLADPGELLEIGFDEAVRRGVAMVEWPDRAGSDLPSGALTVLIEDGATPTGRRLSFSALGDWPARLERTLTIREMADTLGGPVSRRRMAGDASARRFERVAIGDSRMVAMDWPRRGPQPILLDGLSYPELVHVQEDPLSFAAVTQILTERGFVAPTVHALDREDGLLLVDDLGTDQVADGSGPIAERFRAVAEVLAEKDREAWPDVVDVPGGGRWTLPPFAARALLVELSLLPDWYLPHLSGGPIDPVEREAFMAAWAPLVQAIEQLPRGLVLRDVIAANLTWREGATGRRRVGFLDVQDAMIGPRAYDLMALVTDVRLDVDPLLSADVLDAYVATFGTGAGIDRAGLDAEIALLSAQRNSKILGGFARLALRDGKTGYLRHIPAARRRVEAALSHPILRPLRLWYKRHRIVD